MRWLFLSSGYSEQTFAGDFSSLFLGETKMPRVVFVKFHDQDEHGNPKECGWKLPGLTEYGLYPIVPQKGTWFVDKGRKHPVLKIRR